ncbi:MAG TPA: hypothetical protein PLU30_25045 [Verrucomicrobiae bacterium]|nr:hypothetical protein [Verrucomicrobiae bacterium]
MTTMTMEPEPKATLAITPRNNGELAVAEAAPLSPAQILDQVNLIQQVMRAVMRDGEHFGKIPGCGDKPTLLKPGAEKLAMTFRLRPEFAVEVIDLPRGHREVRVVCTLRTANGSVLGQGVGSCSTMESKYRYRSESTGREVPKAYWASRDANLLGGPEFSAKKFDGRWVIVHRVESNDLADAYNTILKMSKKRALVDAVITATAASDIFTQDVEDFRETDEPKGVPKSTQTPPAEGPTPHQKIRALCEQYRIPETAVVNFLALKGLDIGSIDELSPTDASRVVKNWAQVKEYADGQGA